MRQRVKRRITFRFALEILGEGLMLLVGYLVKYLPWALVVYLVFQMVAYEYFREAYCTELKSVRVQILNEEEFDYLRYKCRYLGPFYLANVQKIGESYQLDRTLSIIATALLTSIVPFVIARFYGKQNFPPKTLVQIIMVFTYWFVLLWIVTCIIIYNPFKDWLYHFS